MKKRKHISVFDLINYFINILIVLIMVYPLYMVIIASFSDPKAVITGEVYFLPKGFTLDGYKNMLAEKKIWVGYRNTIIYVSLGVCYDLILTISAGYVMSKKYLPLRTFFTWFFFITMYVGGGMIPSYLLRKEMGLLENPLVLIIGNMSCYNMLIVRNYFSSSISDNLFEAASIDGASEIQRFLKIGLPLSKSIIAVIALWEAVARWNSYMSAVLYIHKREFYPLQLVVREILITNQMKMQAIMSSADASLADMEYAEYLQDLAQTMKYSLVFVVSAPLLIAYPFIQKYFVKGVMVGSVKG